MISIHRTIVSTLAATLLAAAAAWGQFDKLQNSTPEERAVAQDIMMQEKLGLTGEQKEKISAINLKYAKEMEPVIKGDGGLLGRMHTAKGINDAKEAELKQVLTPDQFEKYLASREGMREELGERMAGKARGQ